MVAQKKRICVISKKLAVLGKMGKLLRHWFRCEAVFRKTHPVWLA